MDALNEGQVTQSPPPPAKAKARPGAVWLLVGIAAFLLGLDQLVKHLALQELTDREPVRILGGLIYLSLTRNSGAAFSMASDHTWVFPLITVVVVGWIAFMAARLRSMPWAVALGLVLGGALGNFTDRLFRAPGPLLGHVVDMFSAFGPYGRHFPIFNIADAALTCGVVLAIVLEFTGRQRDGTRVALRKPKAEAGTTDKSDTTDKSAT